MVMAGAQALQLEDSADMEESTSLLPREQYYAKVRAALAALEGTDCILIARTNADPANELDEGIERCIKAHELGAEMTTVVKLTNLEDATYVAGKVPGWKMYPDVAGRHGVPEVTVDQVNHLVTHLRNLDADSLSGLPGTRLLVGGLLLRQAS